MDLASKKEFVFKSGEKTDNTSFGDTHTLGHKGSTEVEEPVTQRKQPQSRYSSETIAEPVETTLKKAKWSGNVFTFFMDSGLYLWYWAVAIYAHFAFGMFPVLGQYLQSDRHIIRSIPTFSLIWVSNLIAILIYSPRILHKLCWSIVKFYGKHFRREFRNEKDFELEDVDTHTDTIVQKEKLSSLVDVNVGDQGTVTEQSEKETTLEETIEDDVEESKETESDIKIQEKDVDIVEQVDTSQQSKLKKITSGDSIESDVSADSTTQMLKAPIVFDRSSLKKRRDPISESIQSSSLGRFMINPWKDWLSMVFSNSSLLLLSLSFYAFSIVFILRSYTNFLSSKLTFATYSQLIGLSAPFIITFLNTFILRRERFSILPILLMITITIGGIFTLLGIASKQRTDSTFQWLPDLSNLQFTWVDLTGCIVSVLTTFFLATQIVFQDSLTTVDRETNTRKIGIENLFLFQKFLLLFVTFVPSILFEDLSAYQVLSWNEWGMLFAFSVGVILLGDIAALYSINRLGSTTYGIGLPLRLVSSMAGVFLLLGYTNSNLFEMVGASIVIFSVGMLMVWKRIKEILYQRRLKSRREEVTYTKEEQFEMRERQISVS